MLIAVTRTPLTQSRIENIVISMLMLLPTAASASMTTALSMSAAAHHPTVSRSASMSASTLHMFEMSTILLTLLRGQKRRCITLALDICDEVGTFRFFQLLGLCLNG